MAEKIIFETFIAGYSIVLRQQTRRFFSVQYGMQENQKLSYAQAAARLGEAIMHASACEGKICQ